MSVVAVVATGVAALIVGFVGGCLAVLFLVGRRLERDRKGVK